MRDLERLLARINWLGLATIALGFALWEIALRAGFAQYQNLPTPSAIAFGLVEIMRNGQLLADTSHTLLPVLVGWLAAVAMGVVLGLMLGASPMLRRYSLASIEVLRPMPGIAFAPVALLLFGFSLQMELMVIILPALWPVLIGTMGAVMGVHARLFEVGRTFRLSARFCKIMLPAALWACWSARG
jgi:ABC-type nitrate/sulfonate/bicarbonate transport system permease component